MSRTFILILTGLTLATGLLGDEKNQELLKIDRLIRKQPTYVAEQPLYALVVVGPQRKTRIWMVLDKSVPSLNQYDVLYVDLNGNGNLTDDGERIRAEVDQENTARFKIPDFTDPTTGAKHTEFSLRCSAAPDPYQMVSLKWKGKQKFGGGYTDNPVQATYSQFASSIEKAPILWLNGDGPFTFQRWYTEALQIGQDNDVKLFIGAEGVGTSTFCAFQVHALPEGEGIHGILRYDTQAGEQRQTPFSLLEKC